jgi:hypothetical protein
MLSTTVQTLKWTFVRSILLLGGFVLDGNDDEYKNIGDFF